MAEGPLEAAVRGWTATSATAELISPDGEQRLPVPLSRRAPGHWRVAKGYRPPQDITPGIWKLQVAYEDGPTVAVSRSAALVIGNALWCGSNSERIRQDDPPRYGKGEVNLAAAGNQWESFQVVVASETGLQDVSMRATDLNW